MKSIRSTYNALSFKPALWMAVTLLAALATFTSRALADSASAQVSPTPGRLIPQNFVGFSHEWQGMDWFFGTRAKDVNYVYRQMIKNLQNGQQYPFLIRIANTKWSGSAETDPNVGEALAELAQDIDVQFTIGVDLIHDNPSTAEEQAKYYLGKLPHSAIAAIEIGNEPDNYGYNGYRHNPYTIQNFLNDYNEWSGRISPMLPSSIQFIGPSWGDIQSLKNFPAFEQGEANKVSVVSQHMYGGLQGHGAIAHDYLLTPIASTAGPTAMASSVALAHSKGQLFRDGEINSIDSGGIDGISNVFEAALWATDVMFEYANVGVDGVNWHGNTSDAYCLFNFINVHTNGKDPYALGQLNPMYYGLLLFQLATSNHSHLLPVSVQTSANLKVWATEDQDGVVHVVVINKDKNFSGNVDVALPGYGDAEAIELRAPNYLSKTGITIGGQTFDGSSDGIIRGTRTTQTIGASNGTYSVSVQPTSAVMLTLTPGGNGGGGSPTTANPEINPGPGTFQDNVSVSISDSTPNATIYYTTDGSTPNTNSTVYSGPFTISSTETINAIATAPGYQVSGSASATYTKQNGGGDGGGDGSLPNYPSGFENAGLTLNGAEIQGTALQLVDGGANETRSAYFASKVNVQSFTNDFDFQILNGVGGGFTFIVQNQGATAVGSAGGSGLGSRTIPHSVAIKFDIFNNAGEGDDSTGVYLNGSSPTVPATDISDSGIQLKSGDVIHAHMVYDGTNLALTLTDAQSGDSFNHTYGVNIPQVVGGSTAYIGFTSATGSSTSVNNVLDWTYTTP